MSWGYKILTFYIVFVIGIVFLVIKSIGQNQDLVITDYYEQELKFQDKIDKVHRANALSAPIYYEVQKDTLLIRFPGEMKDKLISADVVLYCTADEGKDIKRSFKSNNAQILFAIPATNKGLHELKISWSVTDISYYYEHKLILP